MVISSKIQITAEDCVSFSKFDKSYKNLILIKTLKMSPFMTLRNLETTLKTSSKKRRVSLMLCVKIEHLGACVFFKNFKIGRTTSRHATPLGDPRGVPKLFSHSRLSKCFWPIRLEGFRDRATSAHFGDFKSFRSKEGFLGLSFGSKCSKNNKSVRALIEVNCLKMEMQDNPLLKDLLDFIESPSTVIDDNDIGEVSEQELIDQLWSSLESDKNVTDSNNVNILTDLNPSNNHAPNTVIDETIKVEEQTVIPILYNVIQITPNQFLIDSSQVMPRLTTPENDLYCTFSESISSTSASPLSPTSLTFDEATTSSCSVSPSLATGTIAKRTRLTDDYRTMRNENNKSCEKYRRKKKEKEAHLEEELKVLETRNAELNINVRVMEGIVKDLRDKCITDISQGSHKRKRDDSDDLASNKYKTQN